MSTSLLDLLIIAATCLSVYNGFGLAFNIEISPDKVNGLVHNDVSIDCKLDKSDGDVREIMLLELSKEGNRIAVLRLNSGLSIRKGMETKFNAEGNVSQSDVLDSYLHVTLKNPRVDDSGQYTCHLYFLDEFALLRETRTTGNMSVSDQDMKAAVMYLVEKVSTLETEHSDRISSLKASHNETTDKLEQELKEQKDIHKNDVEQLQKGISKQKREATSQISTLQGKVDKQEQRIQNLIEKVNTTVFFTAWHTRTGNFEDGADMVYSEVLDNVGGAYDGTTGKFTAPVDGLYFFDVSVASYAGKLIYLDLKTSDGRLLTRLHDYDGQDYSYSDTSCLTKLLAGEYVHPVIRRISGGYSMYHLDAKEPMNKFYGYLIKTL